MARLGFSALALLAVSSLAGSASAQCDEAQLQNHTGADSVACPCFVPGEEAGVVLEAPAGDYPIEILRVGVGWGSQFGGAPQSLEQAIKIYSAGLPDPGAPIFTLGGPVLTDGVVNEFDLEPSPGEITVDSGPFSVTLEFLNQNAGGNPFVPSVVHDGNGCQLGKNLVKAIPGGWVDACQVGVTGDWVFYVVYRPSCPAVGVDEQVVASAPAGLSAPRPNPFRNRTRIEYFVDREQPVDLSIYDVQGRQVASLVGSRVAAGRHELEWSGLSVAGARVSAGVYFVRLTTSSFQATRKLVYVD